jgi:PAS domain S-box-containing protein
MTKRLLGRSEEDMISQEIHHSRTGMEESDMNQNPIRVLLVDDDEDDFILIRELLSGEKISQLSLGWVSTYHSALSAVKDNSFDFLLVDYRLGPKTGLDFLREIKKEGFDIPAILLTGYSSRDLDLEAQSVGVCDYRLKAHIQGEQLERVIRYSINRWKTLEELRKSKKQVQLLNKELQEERLKLKERSKELNCLYGLSELIEKPGISLQEILAGTTELLPQAWQYPDITRSRISYDGFTYLSQNFAESPWRQAAAIHVRDNKVGVIEIFYLTEQPTLDEGPFSREERALIKGIAERLGRLIEGKETEEELRRSEAQFRAVVENISDGIIFSDARGIITYRSPSLNRITGFSDEDRLGHNGIETVHPDDREFVAQTMNQILENPGLTATGEYRTLHKNGSWIWAEATAQNLLKHPDIQKIFLICHDITERKKTEENLKESELRLNFALEAGELGVWDRDLKTNEVWRSEQHGRIFGYDTSTEK